MKIPFCANIHLKFVLLISKNDSSKNLIHRKNRFPEKIDFPESSTSRKVRLPGKASFLEKFDSLKNSFSRINSIPRESSFPRKTRFSEKLKMLNRFVRVALIGRQNSEKYRNFPFQAEIVIFEEKSQQ